MKLVCRGCNQLLVVKNVTVPFRKKYTCDNCHTTANFLAKKSCSIVYFVYFGFISFPTNITVIVLCHRSLGFILSFITGMLVAILLSYLFLPLYILLFRHYYNKP